VVVGETLLLPEVRSPSEHLSYQEVWSGEWLNCPSRRPWPNPWGFVSTLAKFRKTQKKSV
jgi:hypothetical protein